MDTAYLGQFVGCRYMWRSSGVEIRKPRVSIVMVTATVDEMHWRVPSQHGEMGHEVLMQHEEGLKKGMIEIRPKTRHHLCTVLHVCSGVVCSRSTLPKG